MYGRRYCGGTGPAWCNAYAKGCAEAPASSTT
jgi:hypothetical protein